MRRTMTCLVMVTVTAFTACAGDDTAEPTIGDDPTTTEAPGTTSEPAETTGAPDITVPADTTVPPDVDEPALRIELLAMLDEDQAEQLGEVGTNNYAGRTARLVEILDEYGWPGSDLVGEDGSTAAWVIAQHADLDPEVQQQALDLLRDAAAAGQASGGDLAYLEDRVAVAAGDEQLYGTQMGCAEDGTPAPATPIADEASLEQRRADAGLPPYADYVEEMTAVCADVGQP